MSYHQLLDCNIGVEHPPGAGGNFIGSVLYCCIKNTNWIHTDHNFHDYPKKILVEHKLDPSPLNICIDSPLAKYNFWIYYWKKTVLKEMPYRRYQGQRRPICWFDNLSVIEDGYWFLNQCRYIQTFQSNQDWKIDWIEMIENPQQTWKTINNFLESNQQKNHWTLNQWIQAVDNYKSTLCTIKINSAQVTWKVWAVGVLHIQGIFPPWNVVENFNNATFNRWLSIYNKDVIDYTRKIMYIIG